ncbi:MAG: 2-hydroxyacyl-CoA dehydratase subunit D [Promethearchaeota archaeon]|jgi:benzoyl-CoA reductase/2-hydroxyglutaryl-CoA dehydratase subunit BcrC/BadD/HgdB
MSVMEKFTQAIPLVNPWINSWKNEGKKVLGYFCTYIPDEIIYAADILPVRIRAMGVTDTPMGDAYLTDTSCSFTRCCLELANRKQYEFLDGIISCNSCDQIRRLYDNMRYKTPFFFHHFLNTPGVVNEITIDWFKHELFKFKEALGKNFGVSITDEKLRSAIKIYNKTRTLLKELYMFRKHEVPPITGTEIMNVLTAAVSISREKFNELLIQELKEVNEKEGVSNHKARIMLVGSMLDDPEYVRIVEDLGGLVVTDSLCLGTKYFWDLVDESSDPLGALAERYLSGVSCPRMAGEQATRIQFTIDLINEFKVDGVIIQRMKFCPLWWGEIFMLRRKLKELGIPFLDLEREYVLSGAGAMKTRVQTFIEILEAR